MNLQKHIAIALFALLFTVIVIQPAFAQQDEREKRDETKTKQAQAVSKAVYDQIQKAQELVDKKDYKGAMSVLDHLYNPDKLTEYEQSNVLNYMGFVYYNMDDTKNAIRVYLKMLAIPSLEPQLAKQTTYTLAQLYTTQEEYTKALSTLEKWFTLEPNPAPEPYILKAQLLYQLMRYKDMVPPIETAMDIAKKRDMAVKEDWYVLLNFAYFQQENYKKVRDIQKILLANWPKKRYWLSLAGAYTELGEDSNLIYAYDAAHTQGFLEKEAELVTMAQLYMQAEVPYKAAELLEKEMKSGRVAKNEKNYRLLSQAWTLAQEDDKAIPALTEAARLSNDGELDIRLGNAYLNVGEYKKCIDAVTDGIKKGKLKSPDNAQISLGMCRYSEKQYDGAKAAFHEAAKTERSRKVAGQWINVIDADVERMHQIRLAEEAARKQRQKIEDRKAKSIRG